ncbi:MAG: ActS/PrrB/RegB family redox-sensitive histidine kinase [Caulobacter sp.]|nr:ActS/PrrB/RegB family redox-sensitive histidine kinase [Caulobacter sp.]
MSPTQPLAESTDQGPGLDRLARPPVQAWDALWPAGLPRRGRLRVRTLTTLRWIAIAGQTITVLIVAYGLNLPTPVAACLTIIALSAWLNVLVSLAVTGQRLATDNEAAAHIAFDILQLSALLYLTGGMLNPFSLLLIGPVTLAAATLPRAQVILLALLAIAACIAMSVTALPMPAPNAEPFNPPLLNRIGSVVARVMGIIFTSAYAWHAAQEAARMELALDTAHTVLAREQRLSAVGALAAAAAHELGTPLSTISVVAKEMVLNTPPGPLREDAELLLAQAARCRDILQRLTKRPDVSDAAHDRMSLLQVVEEATAPHSRQTAIRVEATVTGPAGQAPPDIWRLPEVLHALTAFIENAVDFARSEVFVTARFDSQHVTVEVSDDGAGFSAEVLTKLGEPYVTSRPAPEAMRSGHEGMGLGFFIAKTLLERTGAKVEFRNARGGGAVVLVRWRREAIAAPPLDDIFAGG